jgi:hypothetical protein
MKGTTVWWAIGFVVLILAAIILFSSIRENPETTNPIILPKKCDKSKPYVKQDREANHIHGAKELIKSNTRFYEPRSGPLTKNESKQIIGMIEKRVTSKEKSTISVSYDDLTDEEKQIVNKIIYFATNRLRKLFDNDRIQPEILMLHGRFTGHIIKAHADNATWSNEKRKWVPNHLPHLQYSALLYLNDDYDGGVFYFVNSPKERYKFGFNDAMYFTSGYENVHAVEEIRGKRYNVALWCKVD